jgi:hypothetical protein
MIRRKQRWRVHQCETCERWTSAGVMVAAGQGPLQACGARHRVFKWVCADCRRNEENVRSVDQALTAWEIERGYRTAQE